MKLIDFDFEEDIKDHEAYKSLQHLKLPDKKLEEFKKFDLSKLYETSFNFTANSPFKGFKKVDEFINNDFHTLFINNSKIQTPNNLLDKHIKISQLPKEKNVSKNALLHLGETFIELQNKIEISRSLDKPLLIVNLSTSNNSFCPTSLHICVEKNAQVDILELFISSNTGECFLSINRKITLKENALLNYSKVEKSSEFDTSIFNYHSNLLEKSTLNIVSVNSNAKKSLNFWDFFLDHEDIVLNIDAIVNINESKESANIANIVHNKENIRSEINAKHILHDASHAVFEAKSTINREASHAKVFQSSKTTLLSDDARIFAQPQLLIETENLEAKHSATCGAMNEEELYYLISRGIPEEKAEAMLIEAIETEVIEKIHNPTVKKFILAFKGKNDV